MRVTILSTILVTVVALAILFVYLISRHLSDQHPDRDQDEAQIVDMYQREIELARKRRAERIIQSWKEIKDREP